jgi:hypothetical protein
MEILMREDLDGEQCMVPGCSHIGHPEGLYMHAMCHQTAKLDVAYHDGVLTLRCGRCLNRVAIIAVAARRKPS